MDALHITLALGPLAVYLSLLGMINLSRRPFLTTGPRDLYALGVGLSGFAIVGPLDLFMPEPAALRLGPSVWLFLLVFYSLCLTTVVLIVRPRLIIYNLAPDQLRPLLADMISRLEWEHHWAGESLALPGLGVQLQVDRFAAMRNAAIVATSARQSYHGWRILEFELGEQLRRTEVEPNPVGAAMVLVGLLALLGSTAWIVVERDAVALGLFEMLRM